MDKDISKTIATYTKKVEKRKGQLAKNKITETKYNDKMEKYINETLAKSQKIIKKGSSREKDPQTLSNFIAHKSGISSTAHELDIKHAQQKTQKAIAEIQERDRIQQEKYEAAREKAKKESKVEEQKAERRALLMMFQISPTATDKIDGLAVVKDISKILSPEYFKANPLIEKKIYENSGCFLKKITALVNAEAKSGTFFLPINKKQAHLLEKIKDSGFFVPEHIPVAFKTEAIARSEKDNSDIIITVIGKGLLTPDFIYKGQSCYILPPHAKYKISRQQEKITLTLS